MNIGLKNPWHPAPAAEKFDTGLRYTDILFGFVIRELFLRLQNWANLDYARQWHLIVGFTLVLGSWIGFRQSLNRPLYQLKFFNLPLFRFLVDQLMLILYFRIAVLTPAPDATRPWPSTPEAGISLAQETSKLVFCVFVLYAVWDWFAIRMAEARIKAEGTTTPRYPVVRDGKTTNEEQRIDEGRIWITRICLLFFGFLWLFALFFADCFNPVYLFVTTTALLLAYRWFKEMKTS